MFCGVSRVRHVDSVLGAGHLEGWFSRRVLSVVSSGVPEYILVWFVSATIW